MHAVRAFVRPFVRPSVRPSEHFPWSDLDQIWYAASLADPKNRLMTAFRSEPQERCCRCIMVYMGSRRISEMAGASKAHRGIFGIGATLLEQCDRFHHDQSRLVLQQGLHGVQKDLLKGPS